MKLSKHQIEIVQKVTEGEVYDIPSYLKAFEKGHIVKHDMPALKQKFEATEQGKTYPVMRKGNSIYTYTQLPPLMTIAGPVSSTANIPILRSRESIADDEWEYKSATLDETIPPQKIESNGQNFEFDFQNKGVFVADDFEDIKDFITLWSYLKSEALVLEVDKPIEAIDISVFFQLEHIANPNDDKKLNCHTNDNYNKLSDFVNANRKIDFCDGILNEVPVRKISSYLESTWKIIDEHKLMCNEFIGKKILPNNSLRVYSANKYRTTNEIAQNHSLMVAWIAVGLSVIAILIGNILPLFQPSNADYLAEINRNLVEISERITDLQSPNDIANYDEIKNYLQRIHTSLNSMQTNVNTEHLQDLLKKIEEIQIILSERLPEAKASTSE